MEQPGCEGGALAFRTCLDSFDTNAKALKRAEAARRFFDTKLAKLIPSPTTASAPGR